MTAACEFNVSRSESDQQPRRHTTPEPLLGFCSTDNLSRLRIRFRFFFLLWFRPGFFSGFLRAVRKNPVPAIDKLFRSAGMNCVAGHQQSPFRSVAEIANCADMCDADIHICRDCHICPLFTRAFTVRRLAPRGSALSGRLTKRLRSFRQVKTGLSS